MAGNWVGLDGVHAIAEMLKVNTALTALQLAGTQPSVYSLAFCRESKSHQTTRLIPLGHVRLLRR